MHGILISSSRNDKVSLTNAGKYQKDISISSQSSIATSKLQSLKSSIDARTKLVCSMSEHQLSSDRKPLMRTFSSSSLSSRSGSMSWNVPRLFSSTLLTIFQRKEQESCINSFWILRSSMAQERRWKMLSSLREGIIQNKRSASINFNLAAKASTTMTYGLTTQGWRSKPLL